jgi:hypothetical protein
MQNKYLNDFIPGINDKGLLDVEEAKYNNHDIYQKLKGECKPLYAGWCRYFASKIVDQNLDRFEVHKKAMGEEYVNNLIKNSTEIFKKIEDNVFVDLGAGKVPFAYTIATMFNAKAYVGVEPFYFRKLSQCDFSKYAHEEKNIPYFIVPEDMLTFLKRLPNKSATIFISAIDNEVIPSKEYRNNVKKEIPRCISSNGAYIHSSCKSSIYLKDDNFRTITDHHVMLMHALY